jgi:tetratricopeptide (TPR) repeat protein
MNRRNRLVMASGALILLGGRLPLLQAQAPTAPVPPAVSTPAAASNAAGRIAQARADQKAGHFAEALSLLRTSVPPMSPPEVKGLQLAVADVEFAWGQNLLDNSAGKAIAQSLPHYQAALAIDRISRPAQDAHDLRKIGDVYYLLSQSGKAVEYYQKALPLYQQIGDKDGQAMTLSSMGDAYSYLSQSRRGIRFYRQALPLFQQAGDDRGGVVNLIDLADAYRNLRQRTEAIHFFQQALPLIHRIGDKNEEIDALENLGDAYFDLGDFSKAIPFYQQEFSAYQKLGTTYQPGQADALDRIGDTYTRLHQYNAALRSYQQALSLIHQGHDEEMEEARTLKDIEIVHHHLDSH